MKRNFGQTKQAILLVLGETPTSDGDVPIHGTSTSADLLRDAVYAALSAITQRVWRQKTLDLLGGETSYDLPSDLIEVEGVYDLKSAMFLPEARIAVGADAQTNMWTLYGNTGSDNDYGIIYEKPQITFFTEVPTEGARMYYSSAWGRPESDIDELETRELLEGPIILFAASYCLLRQAVASASIRQFNQKVDAGVPTNLPHKDMAEFLLKRFEQELQRIPATKKGVTS